MRGDDGEPFEFSSSDDEMDAQVPPLPLPPAAFRAEPRGGRPVTQGVGGGAARGTLLDAFPGAAAGHAALPRDRAAGGAAALQAPADAATAAAVAALLAGAEVPAAGGAIIVPPMLRLRPDGVRGRPDGSIPAAANASCAILAPLLYDAVRRKWLCAGGGKRTNGGPCGDDIQRNVDAVPTAVDGGTLARFYDPVTVTFNNFRVCKPCGTAQTALPLGYQDTFPMPTQIVTASGRVVHGRTRDAAAGIVPGAAPAPAATRKRPRKNRAEAAGGAGGAAAGAAAGGADPAVAPVALSASHTILPPVIFEVSLIVGPEAAALLRLPGPCVLATDSKPDTLAETLPVFVIACTPRDHRLSDWACARFLEAVEDKGGGASERLGQRLVRAVLATRVGPVLASLDRDALIAGVLAVDDDGVHDRAAALIAMLCPRCALPAGVLVPAQRGRRIKPGSADVFADVLVTSSPTLALACSVAAVGMGYGLSTTESLLTTLYKELSPDFVKQRLLVAVAALHSGHQEVTNAHIKVVLMSAIEHLGGANGALQLDEVMARLRVLLANHGATHTAINSLFEAVMNGTKVNPLAVIRWVSAQDAGGNKLHRAAVPEAKALAASMAFQKHGDRCARGGLAADELELHVAYTAKRLKESEGFRVLSVLSMLLHAGQDAVDSLQPGDPFELELRAGAAKALRKLFTAACDAEEAAVELLLVLDHDQSGSAKLIIHSLGTLNPGAPLSTPRVLSVRQVSGMQCESDCMGAAAAAMGVTLPPAGLAHALRYDREGFTSAGAMQRAAAAEGNAGDADMLGLSANVMVCGLVYGKDAVDRHQVLEAHLLEDVLANPPAVANIRILYMSDFIGRISGEYLASKKAEGLGSGCLHSSLEAVAAYDIMQAGAAGAIRAEAAAAAGGGAAGARAAMETLHASFRKACEAADAAHTALAAGGGSAGAVAAADARVRELADAVAASLAFSGSLPVMLNTPLAQQLLLFSGAGQAFSRGALSFFGTREARAGMGEAQRVAALRDTSKGEGAMGASLCQFIGRTSDIIALASGMEPVVAKQLLKTAASRAAFAAAVEDVRVAADAANAAATDAELQAPAAAVRAADGLAQQAAGAAAAAAQEAEHRQSASEHAAAFAAVATAAAENEADGDDAVMLAAAAAFEAQTAANAAAAAHGAARAAAEAAGAAAEALAAATRSDTEARASRPTGKTMVFFALGRSSAEQEGDVSEAEICIAQDVDMGLEVGVAVAQRGDVDVKAEFAAFAARFGGKPPTAAQLAEHFRLSAPYHLYVRSFFANGESRTEDFLTRDFVERFEHTAGQAFSGQQLLDDARFSKFACVPFIGHYTLCRWCSLNMSRLFALSGIRWWSRDMRIAPLTLAHAADVAVVAGTVPSSLLVNQLWLNTATPFARTHLELIITAACLANVDLIQLAKTIMRARPIRESDS